MHIKFSDVSRYGFRDKFLDRHEYFNTDNPAKLYSKTDAGLVVTG